MSSTAPPPGSGPGRPSGTPIVLVVDDDEDVRAITQLALERFGHWTVVTVDRGERALELVREQHVDAILLDLMMPGMDGLTVFARLQEDEQTAGIPVVLLTAKAQVGPTQVWDGLPLAGVIAKPFSVRTLATEVSSVLGWDPPATT